MQLEIGKRYVTRNGEITGPVQAAFDISYAVPVCDTLWTYPANGYLGGSGTVSPHDLVREYVENPEPAEPTPKQVETKPPDTEPRTLVASPNGGVRDDETKPLAHDVLSAFSNALSAVIDAGTYGARKYAVDNWLGLEQRRVWNSLLRHYLAHCRGETIDPETNLRHLAHMAWNTLAALELAIRSEDEPCDQ